MDPGNDRFKHVWEETQDNLEAVVGSAVSGWARFHAAQTHNPVWTQVRELLSGCCGCCCGWARRVKTSGGGGAGGRDDASFDIFQDLYGDDGELERLLSNNEAFDDDNDGYANRSGENNDDFGEFQQASARWNSKPQKHTRNRSSMSNLMSSLFPGTPAAPAAATAGNRARSDTSRSSDTFRSRTELLGPDPAGDDDAQIMSDGFEASLAFRADGGGASSTASSTHGADSNLAGVGGAGEEEHSEEVSIERELEERPPLPDTNPLTEPAANLSSNHEISSTDELPSGQPETTTSASS
ncbi:hypothetical protein D0Z00_002214 [Geotrichum galactomycetum]|uniref:Uncharacterized protein n=1 Tax=Geotrichum galactomycetum TaxID=27317 RepID=A0ACB6V4T1_9ASCO|nr:hypothetical protein D0Z00_002214 [Geotrichum candidum]